jgi:hypothetical protein
VAPVVVSGKFIKINQNKFCLSQLNAAILPVTETVKPGIKIVRSQCGSVKHGPSPVMSTRYPNRSTLLVSHLILLHILTTAHIITSNLAQNEPVWALNGSQCPIQPLFGMIWPDAWLAIWGRVVVESGFWDQIGHIWTLIWTIQLRLICRLALYRLTRFLLGMMKIHVPAAC